MSPTARAANNSHHCPKDGGREGNCRDWKGGAWMPMHCTAHQCVCKLHREKHLQTEPCPACEKVFEFTGSLPPPAELEPRNSYRPTPRKHQKRNWPSLPKGRGAKRGAGRRSGRRGK